MSKITCFVISPIGNAGSEERSNADDLLELIIEPALEKYGFDIIRADKSNSVGSITSEIIQFVQNSDLCVIDITGHNPNVMYECGRRHETGKPYIMLAKEGDQLPFDINTIRTVFYTTTDPRSVNKTINEIRNFTDKIVSEGFDSSNSGESLSSISDSLRRIERKLDNLHRNHIDNSINLIPSDVNKLLKKLSPIEAFNLALSQRNTQLAESLLPVLKDKIQYDDFLRLVVGQAAVIGSQQALSILEEEVAKISVYENDELQADIVEAYCVAMSNLDREADALAALESYFQNVVSLKTPSKKITAEEKARILNNYQYLYHQSGQYQKAVEIGEIVTNLDPNKGPYYYFLSSSYEALFNEVKCLENVEKYMALHNPQDPDDDLLSHAISVYNKHGMFNEAKTAFDLLKRVNPLKAMLLSEQDEDN